MIASKCLVCGSSNMRADRGFSGRLVCNSCGTPFGVGRRVNHKTSIYSKFSFNNKHESQCPLMLLLLVFSIYKSEVL